MTQMNLFANRNRFTAIGKKKKKKSMVAKVGKVGGRIN